jgi:hypothetical protein
MEILLRVYDNYVVQQNNFDYMFSRSGGSYDDMQFLHFPIPALLE